MVVGVDRQGQVAAVGDTGMKLLCAYCRSTFMKMVRRSLAMAAVAQVKWGVEETGPKFGQLSDDVARALPEMSSAAKRFVPHENIFGYVEETI